MHLGDLDPASLPLTVDTRVAADWLGISPDHLWALVRNDDPPITPLRVGRKLRWPTAPLLVLLGIDLSATAPTVEPDQVSSIGDAMELTTNRDRSGGTEPTESATGPSGPGPTVA